MTYRPITHSARCLYTTFFTLLLSCSIVSAETFEQALQRMPDAGDPSFLDKVDGWMDKTNKTLESVSGLLGSAGKGDLDGIFDNLISTVELYERQTEAHRRRVEGEVGYAEALMTANRCVETVIVAAQANRRAGHYQRALELLTGIGTRETSVECEIIECYFDLGRLADADRLIRRLEAEGVEDALWYRARYQYDTGATIDCVLNIIEGMKKITDKSDIKRSADWFMLCAKASHRCQMPFVEPQTLESVGNGLPDDEYDTALQLFLAAADLYADAGKMTNAFDLCRRVLSSAQQKYPNGSEIELDALIMTGDISRRNQLLPERQRVKHALTAKPALYYLNGSAQLASRIWGKENNPVLHRVNRSLAHAAIIEARARGAVEGASLRRQARNTYRSELALMRQQMRDGFVSMSEGQRTDYMQLMSNLFNDIYNFAEYDRDNKDTRRMVYDSCLLHKSMLLSFSRSVSRLAHTCGDAAILADYNRLAGMRAEVAALEAKADYDKATELSTQANELERKILENVSAISDPTAFMATTCKDLAKTLGPKDIAVEFYSFTNNMSSNGATIERYAYLRPGSDPEIIDISFPRRDIDMRDRMQPRALYMQIWKPLVDKKILKPGMRVLFAPSGRWNALPIEYLPAGEGRYTHQLYDMVRVSTTRTAPATTAPAVLDAVLIGGLDYNMDADEIEMMRADVAERRGGNASKTAWAYLPGTRSEIEDIAAIFSNKGHNARTIVGGEGIEEAVKSLAGSPRHILHIATHGYAGDVDSISPYASPDLALDRCGLVMAGANQAIYGGANNGDDGHLTAREISLLDFSDTRMVVMSACESGLGKLNGEGVYGLQRGFKLAGVQTLVMSLWPVDDEATSCMMSAFYDALLDGRNSRAAFRQAQEAVKAHPAGSDPYVWGAFVIMD